MAAFFVFRSNIRYLSRDYRSRKPGDKETFGCQRGLKLESDDTIFFFIISCTVATSYYAVGFGVSWK